MTISLAQFGTMLRRMRPKAEGGKEGFTFNPRSRQFVTEGYSVGVHPEASWDVRPTDASAQSLRAYATGAAPTWKDPPEHIGGWNPGGKRNYVFDLPEVYPRTPQGHTASRQSMLQHNQEASFILHEGREEWNPYDPGMRQGDIVASDDPGQRQTWAEMPAQVGKVSKGRKKRIRQQGESFS